MRVHGHVLLIAEKRFDTFIEALQDTLEAQGVETIIAHDAGRAAPLFARYSFAAVVLGVFNGDVPDSLLDWIAPLPVIFYGPETTAAAVVPALEQLLDLELSAQRVMEVG